MGIDDFRSFGRAGLKVATPVAVLALALAAGAQDAFAQAAAAAAESGAGESEETYSDAEITVTARRRTERLIDVPIAVTAMSGQQLEQYAVTNVVDIGKFVPSMVIGRQVSGSGASVYLRGVGSSSLSSAFDQSVSFNIDGIAMSRGREIVLAQYDVQQIEVLKGPQSLFFGKNATGGVISVTTRRPTDEFFASARVGHGFNANEFYGEGVLSGPITPTLGARLAVYGNRNGGYFVNTAQPTVDTVQANLAPGQNFERLPVARRRGESKSLSGRLTVDFEPTPELLFSLKMSATRYEDNGPADMFERVCGGGRTTPQPVGGAVSPYADCEPDGRTDHGTLPVAVAAGMREARDGRPYGEFNSQFVSLNSGYTSDNFSLSSITGYYHFRDRTSYDVNGVPRAIWQTLFVDYKQFSQELRFATDFDGPWNFVVGGYFADQDFTYNTDAYIMPAPIAGNTTYNTFARNSGFDATTYSVFGELDWDIFDSLELSAGARWSREKRDSIETSLPANSNFSATFPAGRDLIDNYHESNISPQATLTWKPGQDVSIYAAYREGFKSGGYNLSQVIRATTTVGQGQYRSETGAGWEIGVHASLLNHRLRVNAAVYDYDYDDLQVQFYDSATFTQIVSNAGGLRTRGIEFDFSYDLPGLDGLNIHGAAAYNDAEYGDFIGACYSGQTIAQGCNRDFNNGVYNSRDLSGRTPPRAPKFAGQFGAAYEFGVGSDLSARLTGDLNYSSSYNFSDLLRPDAVQKRFARIDASFTLKDADDAWSVSLIGRNLTDKLVVTSGNDMLSTGGAGTGTAVGVVSDINAIVERGREFYLEFKVKF